MTKRLFQLRLDISVVCGSEVVNGVGFTIHGMEFIVDPAPGDILYIEDAPIKEYLVARRCHLMKWESVKFSDALVVATAEISIACAGGPEFVEASRKVRECYQFFDGCYELKDSLCHPAFS